MRERVKTQGTRSVDTHGEQDKDFHGKLLQFSFPASTPAPRSNPSRIHPRTSIHPRLSPRLSTLRFFSPSSPTFTALSSWFCLPPVLSSTFTPRPFTKPVGSHPRYTGLLCVGNRWRNSPIWHATWSKCGRSGSELRSAQCTTLFSSCFNSALTIFLFNPTRRSVDSYQSLISSTTSTFQIHMSSASCVSSSSLGGINHGRAKCVGQRPEVANFSHREMTSTRQTSTSPVPHLSYVTSLLFCSDISSAMAFVTYILLAALQSGLQSRFNPEIFGVAATKAIVVLILDFLFVKGGCYLLGIQGSNPIVDLIAYSGYKFVGCVVGLAKSSTETHNWAE
jgi:hypothetical protein